MPPVGMAGSGGLPDAAFRTIVDTLSIPVLVMAQDGTITYAGGSTARDFGVGIDGAVGRNVLEFLPPEEVEEAIATMADLAEHERVGIGVPTVYTILRADRTATRQAIAAVPLLDDPDVQGIVLYFLPWDAQLHLDDSLARLLAGDPLDDVLSTLSQAVAVSLEAIGAAVHHGFDGDRFGSSGAWNVPHECLALEESPWRCAVEAGKPVYAPTRVLPPAAAGAATAAGIAGVWAIPIDVGPDVAPAVLTVWRPVHAEPVTAHDFVVTRCLRYVQLTLVRSAEHEQLAHLASHDPLTGTANRFQFRSNLERALETGGPAVLLFCDMDRFKAVNDGLGHGVGDEVLVELVQRLRSVLRPGDHLARIGGDEFTVLLRTDEEGARQVAERLVEVTAVPFEVGESTIDVGLSVGIAVARPGDTPDQLLRRADGALYEAKGNPSTAIAVARS